jgi:hypothetical protein
MSREFGQHPACVVEASAGDKKPLQRRYHSCRDTSAREHADYENSRARNDARWPNGQQFGPPQASRTGSLCTDATIATPVPIASASKTKIAAVIFMAPSQKHDHD